jgi:hypothetical protein
MRKRKLGPAIPLKSKGCFASLIKESEDRVLDHHFDQIKSFQDFAEHVPMRDYEDLKPMLKKW